MKILTRVKYFGNADKESLVVGGPDGPLAVDQDPSTVYPVFEFDGWDPNGRPEGDEDEAVGHHLANLMAAVGNAGADGKYEAEEVAAILRLLDPKAKKALEGIHADQILSVSQQVMDALKNDGKVDFGEGAAIVLKVAGMVGGSPGEIVQKVVEFVSGLFGR